MKYILYNHVGSANHGCEALVRTIAELFENHEVWLFSEHIEEERQYGITEMMTVKKSLNTYKKMSIEFVKAYIRLKLYKDYFPIDTLPYLESLKEIRNGDVLVSIGGDIYCYENYPKYIQIHKKALNYTKESILLGCSIEPSSLKDKKLLEDLKSYNLISARESITYDAMKRAGLKNVIYCPDSAFKMKAEYRPLPTGFIENNTVGINISPLVIQKETKPGILIKNYKRLIQHILTTTDYAVALIPHVVWESNDDRKPLTELYLEFKDTGRVIMIEDNTAPVLKGYIARCKLFIGARTHATIAAYSSCIPTLVIGYSVKSKGIAKDLFGTHQDYVLSVQQICDEDELISKFTWLNDNRNRIKGTLSKIMTSYIKKIDFLQDKFSC